MAMDILAEISRLTVRYLGTHHQSVHRKFSSELFELCKQLRADDTETACNAVDALFGSEAIVTRHNSAEAIRAAFGNATPIKEPNAQA